MGYNLEDYRPNRCHYRQFSWIGIRRIHTIYVIAVQCSGDDVSIEGVP